MGRTLRFLLAHAVALFALATPVLAQPLQNCAICHARDAQMPTVHRTADWLASGHAAASVGCQSCHGGNMAAEHEMDAHRGVLRSASPLSTVNEVNLTSTCASCHRATAVAVSGTIHEILAEAGDPRTPTCVTCHGLDVSQMPTPAEAERQCASCHKPGSARASYPAAARDVLTAIASLRANAATLAAELAGETESPRRVQLTGRLLETQALIKDASAAFHEFRPATLTTTLTALRQRLADISDARATGDGRQ